MARTLTWLLMLIPGSLMAQNHVNYELKGSIKKFTPGEKIYLLHFAGFKRFIDSATITNGSFIFKGSATISNEPEENYIGSAARLFVDHSGSGINFNVINTRSHALDDMATVYLEQGVTDIKLVDSAHNAVILPPKSNSGYYTLDSIYAAYFKKYNRSGNEAVKLKLQGNAYLNYQDEHSRIYKAEQDKDKWVFVKYHPSSPVSLYILKHDEQYYPEYNEIEPYFSALSATLKNTAFGRQYAEMLNGLKQCRLGAQAPSFKMGDPHGKSVSLSSFKGKYVLVDFWASWCGPCRQENPAVVKAYEQFKDKNFTILGVSLDQKKDAWLKAITDDHLDWAQVSDLQYWDNAAAQLYAVHAIPQNFLLDPAGKIIAKNLFGKALTDQLEKIFDATGNANNLYPPN